MQELNDIELRRVAGGMYQADPLDAGASTHRNPLYMYLDATRAPEEPTNVKVVAL